MPYQKLVEGFSLFQKEFFDSEKKELYQKLVQDGQTPETLVIACSDSRIDPAIVTSSTPGDFFAIRNVAALVPPYNNGSELRGTSSAIEFAVRQLQVKHIVVLGHAGCGGIQALQNLEDQTFEFLGHWVRIAEEARDKVTAALHAAEADPMLKATLLEQASILVSLNNLLTFPWIAERCRAGTLHIHGWFFNMYTGELLEYNARTHTFCTIQNREGQPAPFAAEDYSLESFLNAHNQHCRNTHA